MPVIWGGTQEQKEAFPNVLAKILTGTDLGAVSLTVIELNIAPGFRVPLHIHPDHEESMVVLEGHPEATLGEEVVKLGPGDAVLAPEGVLHRMVNATTEPVRILAIFPTTEPKREVFE